MSAVAVASRVEVPRLWPGGTVACLATGPSLTQADVDLVRAKCDGVIAINDAVKLCPTADILYACDGKWWKWHGGVPYFHGLKYALKADAAKFRSHGVQMLRNTGTEGLEVSPDGVRTGKNSGYQAINVAFHTGASRILLLGYDMHGGHFFGKHPDMSHPPFALILPLFQSLVAPLAERKVSVINCTRKTALGAFRRQSLEEALAC